MDANIGDFIKKSVKEMARVSKGQIRLGIWGGLGVNKNTGDIFVCPSDGANMKIYAAKKSALKQWRDGTYQFSYEDLVVAMKIMGINATNSSGSTSVNNFNFTKEAKSETPSSDRTPQIFSQTNRSTIIGGNKSLINEVAFFIKEVYLCGINPISRMAFRDGIVDPRLHEVSANIVDQSNITFDTISVDIVLKRSVDPKTLNYVPKGGGRAARRFNPGDLSFRISGTGPEGPGSAISARMTNAGNFISNSDQSDDCYIKDRDEPLQGDIWYNGIRSSITNGIYQVWVDDIGGGPMVSASRQSVYEAAARYKKNISPTSERYAGYRTNPAANKLASNAITPVKIYVENWWEDPQLYAGIISVLFALMQTLDEKQDSFEFSEKFIDAGAFDYDKMYKPMEGMDA